MTNNMNLLFLNSLDLMLTMSQSEFESYLRLIGALDCYGGENIITLLMDEKIYICGIFFLTGICFLLLFFPIYPNPNNNDRNKKRRINNGMHKT